MPVEAPVTTTVIGDERSDIGESTMREQPTNMLQSMRSADLDKPGYLPLA
jgi:hypothetical protein